jgi:3-deoxy-D-manno-octulosonic-acid transferase
LKIKGIYFLYRSFQAFGLPLVLLYFLWRGLRNRAYWKSIAERLGFLPSLLHQTGPGAIWLHAVSVGEILALVEFVKELRRELPRTPIFVSTSTLAGRAVADEKLHELADGNFYAPVDYVWAVRRVLRTLKPSVVVIAETEIWPNLFREVKRTGAGLAIVNGRISDLALPRYRAWIWLFRTVLPAADRILAQNETMRRRFVELGALPERVSVGGNFKYDFEPRPAAENSPLRALVDRLRAEQIWIAASTMPPAFAGDVDEDAAVIEAFQRVAAQQPGLLLILAPRKPEQFDRAARKIEAAGLRYVRRSRLEGPVEAPAVLLLDSIGELSGLFLLADVVFLGGTLAARGGHNILEPALFRKPVILGPHMENFQEIAEEFRAARACVEIAQPSELASAVAGLLRDRNMARALGERARECAEARRGAVKRGLCAARELYQSHLPQHRVAQPWFALGWPQEWLWIRGALRRQSRALRKRRKLAVPVISIGNITMGGTGKTPCVLRLAAVLRDEGRTPGILTRGYGRASPERHLILAAGAVSKAEHTGDEPQLFLRAEVAAVGIGADRYETGTMLHRQFGVDIALLDDGFQHRRLERDADIVLLDALDPFGGGRVFPLGRLREPLEGLAHADIFLISRADLNDLAPAIEHEVRRWNRHGPIFRSHLEPRAWFEQGSGKRYEAGQPPFGRAAAFCGVGNPHSFRRMLRSLGILLVDWLEFDDHHRYRPREVRHIAAQARARGASALITTAKDAVNLCESASELAAPLPIYWLEVELVVERESVFLDEIRKRFERCEK